jgi:hypothetical protein
MNLSGQEGFLEVLKRQKGHKLSDNGGLEEWGAP